MHACSYHFLLYIWPADCKQTGIASDMKAHLKHASLHSGTLVPLGASIPPSTRTRTISTLPAALIPVNLRHAKLAYSTLLLCLVQITNYQ